MGPESSERGGPLEGSNHDVGPMGGLELGQFFEVALERVMAATRAAAPLMKESATGPSAQNAFSVTVLGRTGRLGRGLGPP
jgi:hypothetical protein